MTKSEYKNMTSFICSLVLTSERYNLPREVVFEIATKGLDGVYGSGEPLCTAIDHCYLEIQEAKEMHLDRAGLARRSEEAV